MELYYFTVAASVAMVAADLHPNYHYYELIDCRPVHYQRHASTHECCHCSCWRGLSKPETFRYPRVATVSTAAEDSGHASTANVFAVAFADDSLGQNDIPVEKIENLHRQELSYATDQRHDWVALVDVHLTAFSDATFLPHLASILLHRSQAETEDL